MIGLGEEERISRLQKNEKASLNFSHARHRKMSGFAYHGIDRKMSGFSFLSWSGTLSSKRVAPSSAI